MPEAREDSSMDEQDKSVGQVQVNGDGDRQVLAPTDGPREELINTAIKFLQNPKVMGSPLYQKKSFLSKKGLTKEEIDLAVERAGVTEKSTAINSTGTQAAPLHPNGYHSGALVPTHPNYPIAHPPVPPKSGWARARDVAFTSVIVAGVSYGVYQLFKTYILPLIAGTKQQEKRIDRLETQIAEIHTSVNESLAEISRTLAAIQFSINSQTQQSAASQAVGRGITDLKADLSSLRSLLLNKNQFPAPPTTAPILPSWQLAGASSGFAQQIQLPSSATTSTTSHPISQSVSEEAVSASPSGLNESLEGGDIVMEQTPDFSSNTADETSLSNVLNRNDQNNPEETSVMKDES